MLELYDRIKLQLLLCHIAYTPRTTWLQMNGGDSANKQFESNFSFGCAIIGSGKLTRT